MAFAKISTRESCLMNNGFFRFARREKEKELSVYGPPYKRFFVTIATESEINVFLNELDRCDPHKCQKDDDDETS